MLHHCFRFPLRLSVLVGLMVFGGVTVYFGLGCQTIRGGQAGIVPERPDEKITADACSFNARLWRDGKPTTFKLELYYTDSLVGIAGRGYLGKGALKGRLSADSIRVYFPGTNEYYFESLNDLTSRSDCPVPLASLNVIRLLSALPDSLQMPDSLKVISNYSDPKRPTFSVRPINTECKWGVDLGYVLQGKKWTIEHFQFVDGEDLVLKATREKYRAGAGIPLKRFEVEPPGDAVRITR